MNDAKCKQLKEIAKDLYSLRSALLKFEDPLTNEKIYVDYRLLKTQIDEKEEEYESILSTPDMAFK